MALVQLALSQLPPLDQADVQAVRSYFPGKLLGRTAAFLSLVLLVLAFAAAAKLGVSEAFGHLALSPFLTFVLFIALPLGVVAVQLIAEWRGAASRKAAQELAVKTQSVPSGYFRIGPYLENERDMARFSRADRAHEKVLEWVQSSPAIPLYLTGDSGSGKSSLLNSFVIPKLRATGWTVLMARALQDPADAIRTVLCTELAEDAPSAAQDPAELLDAVLARVERGLVLVLDQFEEFIILGEPKQKERFAAFIGSLKQGKLRLLLVLRSDYQAALDDLDLPRLGQNENWRQLGRFTLAAATAFMDKSNLNLPEESLQRLLQSASELDDSPGMVRPITLNVIGYVLSESAGAAPSLNADELVRDYISRAVEQPAIREFAPRVLDKMVTDQGTKYPRSEADLQRETCLRRGEVRAVLNGLADAGLARPLDARAATWELSHDFVARGVNGYLRRGRKQRIGRIFNYAAPALLVLTVAVAGGALLWQQGEQDRIHSQLAAAGFISRIGPEGTMVKATYDVDTDNIKTASLLLRKLWPPIASLDFSPTTVRDITPLQALPSLMYLDLSTTWVNDISPIARCNHLRRLNISETFASSLRPLRQLKELKYLRVDNINAATHYDFTVLPKSIIYLSMRGLHIARPTWLKQLSVLTFLDLSGNLIRSTIEIPALSRIERLYLESNKLVDLHGVDRFKSLRVLDLSHNDGLTNIDGVQHLKSLDVIELSGDQHISDFSPIVKNVHVKGVVIGGESSRERHRGDQEYALLVNAIEQLGASGSLRQLTVDIPRPAITDIDFVRGEIRKAQFYRRQHGLGELRVVLRQSFRSPPPIADSPG